MMNHGVFGRPYGSTINLDGIPVVSQLSSGTDNNSRISGNGSTIWSLVNNGQPWWLTIVDHGHTVLPWFNIWLNHTPRNNGSTTVKPWFNQGSTMVFLVG